MLKLTKNTLLAAACTTALVACGGHSGPSENSSHPNLTFDQAVDMITDQGRIHNNDHANISTNLEDWQVKNLALYTLFAYDFSQQVNEIATDHYDINFHDHTQLFSHILANIETGFNDSHFLNITHLNDICDSNAGTPYHQFTVREDQIFDQTNTSVTPNLRDAKVHVNLQLDECQFDYTQKGQDRVNTTHGNMTYEFDFINEVNAGGSETPSSFNSKMHGKWLVSSETLGYKDNFGYWLIENLNANSNYTRSSSSTDIITSELRTDMYIRDAYNNWDHRYFVNLNSANIKTKLGSSNPYSGSLILTTDNDSDNLIIEFDYDSVDIYINGDRVYNDLSWSELRATSLDIDLDR